MSRDLTIEHNGITYTGQIAIVESTFLGMEDHGIFTANVAFKAGGWGQGTGHYCLDAPIKDEDGKFLRREGTGYGMDYIMAVIEVFGARSWESIKGMSAIVLRENDYGMILGIAHLHDENKVLVFTEHLEAWMEAHGGQFV